MHLHPELPVRLLAGPDNKRDPLAVIRQYLIKVFLPDCATRITGHNQAKIILQQADFNISTLISHALVHYGLTLKKKLTAIFLSRKITMSFTIVHDAIAISYRQAS